MTDAEFWAQMKERSVAFHGLQIELQDMVDTAMDSPATWSAFAAKARAFIAAVNDWGIWGSTLQDRRQGAIAEKAAADTLRWFGVTLDNLVRRAA